MTRQDRRMVDRFRHADPGGFDAVFSAYGARVYRFCHYLTGSPSDAEELAQDVFLSALRGAGTFEGRSELSTWLFKIAVRCWRRRCSRLHVETVPMHDVANVVDPRAEPDGMSAGYAALVDAIAALPEDLRLAFVLVKVEGSTYREAASVLGSPQGTVQYRVHEARVRLQDALAGDMGRTERDARVSAETMEVRDGLR